MATPGERKGFFAGLKGVASTLLAIAQTRIELIGNEFEVEKLRILRMLMLAQAVLFSATVGVLLFVAFMTLWLWELRLGVLAVSVLVVGAIAALAYRELMRLVNDGEPAFAATLAELREDIRRLKAESHDAKSSD